MQGFNANILEKEINTIKGDEKFSLACSFWNIPEKLVKEDDVKKIADNITDKINAVEMIEKISTLNEVEAAIFEILLRNDGKLYRTAIKNNLLKKHKYEDWEENLFNLRFKLLIYERKSLSNLSDKNHLYSIFPDILKILENYNVLDLTYYKKCRFNTSILNYECPCEELGSLINKMVIHWRWDYL